MANSKRMPSEPYSLRTPDLVVYVKPSVRGFRLRLRILERIPRFSKSNWTPRRRRSLFDVSATQTPLGTGTRRTVPDEPAQCEAEFAGPFDRKVEDRGLSVRSDVQIRGSERQSAFLRELSLSRLDQQLVDSWYQVCDFHPTCCRQYLVIRGRRQLEAGFRCDAPNRFDAGPPSGHHGSEACTAL